MFYYLSKTLDVFFFPVTWISVFFIASIVSRKKNRQSLFRVISLVLLLFFGNNFVVRTIANWWEIPARSIHGIPPQARVGVILSGVIDVFREIDHRVFVRDGADRILHAAFLYQNKIIDKLLITGSFVLKNGAQRNEAQMIKTVLVGMGVPEKDIWLEEVAKNTFENAAFSVAILREKNIHGPILLITSAFHMRRSLACFRKQGQEAVPFPVDFQFDASGTSNLLDPLALIPSATALQISAKLFREIAGYGIYSLKDYL